MKHKTAIQIGFLLLGTALPLNIYGAATTMSATASSKNGNGMMAKATLGKVGKVLFEKPPSVKTTRKFIDVLSHMYISNPQIQAAVRKQFSVAESVPQALSGWRPSIIANLTGSKARTDQDGFRRLDPTVAPLDLRKVTTTRQGSLTLSQNLFDGFQTTNKISKAENQVLAGEADLLNTEEKVLLDAITAFVDIWRTLQVLEFRKSSEEFLKRNLEQIRAEREVGEKTITEQAEAETRLAQAISDRISAEADVQSARATYEALMGVTPGDLDEPPPLLFEKMSLPKSLKELVDLSVDRNPAVLNAFFTEKAALYSANAAEGVILPSLDLQLSGTRTLSKDNSAKGLTNPPRDDTRTTSGQASLQLKIPLYQSGSEWSAMRQAYQDRYTALNNFKQARRKAEQDAVQAWEQWKANEQAVYQLHVSVKAAEINLEGKRQEFLVGENTLTDMLQAQSQLVQAQANLVEAQRRYILAGFQVASLYGNLTPESLGLSVTRFDVKGYASQVRGQFIGIGDMKEELGAADAKDFKPISTGS